MVMIVKSSSVFPELVPSGGVDVVSSRRCVYPVRDGASESRRAGYRRTAVTAAFVWGALVALLVLKFMAQGG